MIYMILTAKTIPFTFSINNRCKMHTSLLAIINVFVGFGVHSSQQAACMYSTQHSHALKANSNRMNQMSFGKISMGHKQLI